MFCPNFQKQIDKLKVLLTKSYVTEALNRCSELKQKDNRQKLFGWNSLFKVNKTTTP